MKHCVECGAKLEPQYLEGEGMIPYCAACGEFRFPIFNVAVSVIIKNPAGNKILFIQQYGKQRNILVAGYVNKGESAEQAVAREVMEEVGLAVKDIRYNRSEYFEKSNALILNFTCSAESDAYVRNESEVDRVAWFDMDTCKAHIASGSLAEAFLHAYLDAV